MQKQNDNLDKYGRNPLHYAAADNNQHAAIQMIRDGADVNLRDKNGWTALHFAAQEYAVEIARLLIQAGADVNARDSNGNTPLWRAVYDSNGNGEIIALLHEHGADPFAMNNHGVSPLQLSRLIANYNTAQYFSDLAE